MIDVSAIKQYDYSGKLIRDIKLPGLGTAGGFSGKKRQNGILFLY
jgi:prolyl oligopeptidase